MAKREEIRVNLVRPQSGDTYVPMKSWEVIALGDKVRVIDARTDGKMHVTYYVRTDQ